MRFTWVLIDNAHVPNERPGPVSTKDAGTRRHLTRIENMDKEFPEVTCFMEKPSASRRKPSGRPSRATRTTVIAEMIDMRVKVLPLSLGVL
jgi:hypothetical protein